MQGDGFNKSKYHQLTTTPLTVGLFLTIYRLFFKKLFHYGQNKWDIYFPSPTVALYYNIFLIYLLK